MSCRGLFSFHTLSYDKRRSAGHAIVGLSYVGLKYSALCSNFDLGLWSLEAFFRPDNIMDFYRLVQQLSFLVKRFCRKTHRLGDQRYYLAPIEIHVSLLKLEKKNLLILVQVILTKIAIFSSKKTRNRAVLSTKLKFRLPIVGLPFHRP